MFWSSQTLSKKLHSVIKNGKEERIETGSYCLTIGPEVFITPNYESHELKDHTKIILDEDQNFNIPYGQFAFLLTEEEVHVPKDTIAFISFKAKKKFKGLVNVSGFHVDPGYKGRLIFALFNAGPKTITLKRGEEFFLIWFANLDEETNDAKEKPIRSEIDTDIINDINGEVYNPMVIKDKIVDLKEKISMLEAQKIPEVESRIKNYILTTLIASVMVLSIGYLGKSIWEFHRENKLELIQFQIQEDIKNAIRNEMEVVPVEIKRLVQKEFGGLEKKSNSPSSNENKVSD